MHQVSGSLKYVLYQHRHGRVDFTVRLQDSGNSTDGRNEVSRNLTLYVLPVNDAPTFSLQNAVINLTDSEVVGTEGTIRGYPAIVNQISKGGWREDNQKVLLTMEIITGPERMFVPLRIDCGSEIGWSTCPSATGDLFAMPRPRRFGTNVINVRVTDNGGQPDYSLLTHGILGAPPPVNTSVGTGNITLTLTPVDQKPLFHLATDRVRVLQDSGCITSIPGWDYMWGFACNRSVPRRCVSSLL
jgi:hypothetical protein